MRRHMEGRITMSVEYGMKPRLLLVEDDPTSLQFMRAVVQALPCQVDAAGSVAEALAMDADTHHDLWLLDANLPDGTGSQLLAQLRSRPRPARQRLHVRVPAVAHTADDSPGLRARLLRDGFEDVLLKPLTAASLGASIRRWLGQHEIAPALRIAEPPAMLPLWDHTAALAALNGSETNLSALRRIFLLEVVRQRAVIMAAIACGETAAVTHQLHQLKASSGFVGACRLQAATAALGHSLRDPELATAFEAVLQETVSAG